MPQPDISVPAAALSGCLPYPFEDVSFTWDAPDDRFIQICYQGEAARLIECGAIEPGMAMLGKKGVKRRLDSAGHYFTREVKITSRELNVRTALRINRYIDDPEFAKTLPGMPTCNLRFKRLDWLDAHPDQLHIWTHSQSRDYEMYGVREIHYRKRVAGTAASLVAAGYSEKVLCRKPAQRPGYWSYFTHGELGNEGGRLTRLMRGYFEIDFGQTVQKPLEPKPEVKAPKRTPLRLVVDNEVRT